MRRQEADELLADHPRGAENPDFDALLGRVLRCAHGA